MRSGTTRLHRLLAADHRFAHLRLFESVCPVPAPGFMRSGIDRRPLAAAMIVGAVHRFNPHTAAIHPTGVFEAEEELGMLVASFWGMKHEAQWRVPSYGRWCEGRDGTPAYEHMAQLLRLAGWARGQDDALPWILKTPQHALDLPSLLRVFPDARIIFAHRDPESVVGSSCSLVWNQMVIHSRGLEPRDVGCEWLRKSRVQVERMRAGREAIPARRRIDVRFEDMERDWRAVMKRIYGFLDMDIAPALPAMAAYLDRAQRLRNGYRHNYSLAAFGLDTHEVGEMFSDYRQAFDLRLPEQTPEARAEALRLRAKGRRPAALPT
jgi:hypothetical protein